MEETRRHNKLAFKRMFSLVGILPVEAEEEKNVKQGFWLIIKAYTTFRHIDRS